MSEDAPERKHTGPEDPATSASPDPAPMSETEARHESAAGPPDTSQAALFSAEESQSFKTRWSDIQADFVDQPREAVNQADRLAGEIIDRLSTIFAEERSRLEDQWAERKEPSTEDLRLTFRRYRSLVDRLLSS